MDEAPLSAPLVTKRAILSRKIKQICNQNEIPSDPAQIAGAFVDYYNNVFAKKLSIEEGLKTAFLNFMAKLDDEVKAELEAPISISEIDHAIDELTTGKSLGPDCLGATFYKILQSKIVIL